MLIYKVKRRWVFGLEILLCSVFCYVEGVRVKGYELKCPRGHPCPRQESGASRYFLERCFMSTTLQFVSIFVLSA